MVAAMRLIKLAWRHLRYWLEFGVLYYLGVVVIPLRERLAKGTPPQLVDRKIDTTGKGDLSQQKVPPLQRWLSRKISSGGTTGVPVTFYEYLWVTGLERMYGMYLWSLVGWRPTDRTVVFRGNRIAQPTERRGRMLYVSSYMMGDHLDEVAARIAEFRPQWVWAYPSVFLSYRRLAHADAQLAGVKGFLFFSEKLHGWQREELARAHVGTRILEGYGASEKAALAHRIHPSPHYTFLSSYSEVLLQPLDGEEDWPRRCALIGTSHLQAPSRVRNFLTGDIAIVAEDGTVLDILGREQELVHLADGRTMAFSQVIGSIHVDVWEHIRRFRFEQRRVGEIEVHLEVVTLDRCADIRKQFEALITEELAGAIKLNFHFGPLTPRRSPAGKAIYFVQHLSAETGTKLLEAV